MMMQRDELASAEQDKLIEVANRLATATGSSANRVLGDLLRVMDTEIIRASAIPAHFFAEPEKVASKPFRVKWR